MFRIFLKNKKGQNTAEYALLIALVVAGIIAMQQYAQRALQARVRDGSVYMMEQTKGVLGTAVQYEPYYQKSDYTVSRNSQDSKILDTNEIASDSRSDRSRLGNQVTTYSPTATAPTINETMPKGI